MSYEFPLRDDPMKSYTEFMGKFSTASPSSKQTFWDTAETAYLEDEDAIDQAMDELRHGPVNKRGRATSWSPSYLVKAFYDQGLTWISANGTHHAIATMEHRHALNTLLMLERVEGDIRKHGGFKPSGCIQDTPLYKALKMRVENGDAESTGNAVQIPPGEYDGIARLDGETVIYEFKVRDDFSPAIAKAQTDMYKLIMDAEAAEPIHTYEKMTGRKLYQLLCEVSSECAMLPWSELEPYERRMYSALAVKVDQFADARVVEYVSQMEGT